MAGFARDATSTALQATSDEDGSMMEYDDQRKPDGGVRRFVACSNA